MQSLKPYAVLIVHFQLGYGLIFCAENVPKIIIFYGFTWEDWLTFGIKRDLFCELHWICEPVRHKEVNINLKGLVMVGIVSVFTTSNDQTVLFLFVFWIFLKEYGWSKNFPFPQSGLLDKNKLFSLDLIHHTLEIERFLFLFISKNKNEIFTFVLNMLNFHNIEFLL